MIKRFANSSRGAIALITALTMTVILGVAGLGVDVAYWNTVKRAMQGAADAGAIEAAAAYSTGNTGGYVAAAQAVAAQNGWLNGGGASSTVTVAVNTPPTFGNFASATFLDKAFEVIISRPQPTVLAWAVGFSSHPTVSAHAVALLTTAGGGCVLALNNTANAIKLSGAGRLTANGCGVASDGSATLSGSANLTASSLTVGTSTSPCAVGQLQGGATCTIPSGKIKLNATTSDPYSGRSFVTPPATPACTALPTSKQTTQSIPQGSYCNVSISNLKNGTNFTFASGTFFSGAASFSSTLSLTFGSPSGSNVFYFDGGASFGGTDTVTFEPGIYYVEGGSFTVSNSATLHGADITVVLTKDASKTGTYGTATISGSGIVTLSAPTGSTTIAGVGTENTAGLIFFQDPNAPTSPNNTTDVAVTFSGSGSGASITGAIYAPREVVNLSGAGVAGTSSGCTQVVSQFITVTGSGQFANGCTGDGTANFGGSSTVAMAE